MNYISEVVNRRQPADYSERDSGNAAEWNCGLRAAKL